MEMEMDLALVAKLVSEWQRLVDLGNFCQTCKLLQRVARNHAAIQKAALPSQILGLASELLRQEQLYTAYDELANETMDSAIALSFQAVTMLLRTKIPWTGRYHKRLVFILDAILRNTDWVQMLVLGLCWIRAIPNRSKRSSATIMHEWPRIAEMPLSKIVVNTLYRTGRPRGPKYVAVSELLFDPMYDEFYQAFSRE
jgi:hypothetical protein